MSTNKPNGKEATKIFILGYYLEKTGSIIHSKVSQSILGALIEQTLQPISKICPNFLKQKIFHFTNNFNVFLNSTNHFISFQLFMITYYHL
jgi:hypothetical protein